MRDSSSLAWLDLSEKSREEMQEHLQLLMEPGTLDELGVGQVRDVFSNLFFPGTSTLWSRARYLFFVPWVYQNLEREGTGRKSGRDAARGLQAKLIRALKRGGDEDGLIGRQVGVPVVMPDDVTWNGLQTWGIRVREGGLAQYRRALQDGSSESFSVLRGESGETLDVESGSWWHPRLPAAPSNLFDTATFALSANESAFLRDQLLENHPQSLLARAVEGNPLTAGNTDVLWECEPLLERLDKPMRAAVDHARVFAYAMQAAGLTYSWLVATKKAGPAADLSMALAEALEDWFARCQNLGVIKQIEQWEERRKSFWDLVNEEHPGLRDGTQRFIDDWMLLAARPASELLSDPQVEDLIRDREWVTKRNLARLSSAKALDNAKAEAGTGLMPFRWRQVRRIIDDISTGLER